MKSYFLFGCVTFLIGIFTSCTNNNDLTANPSPTEINNFLQNGQWKISYYYDRDKEKTSNFSGFVFEFKIDNKLIAKKLNNMLEGSWSILLDSGKTKLNVQFLSTKDFEEISEDWEIISMSDKKIELIHVSGGDGHKDYLTFEKK